MGLLEKIKETVYSVLPIYIIVLILHFTISPLETSLMVIFTISTLLVVIGLSMFNLGVDNSIEKMGNVLTLMEIINENFCGPAYAYNCINSRIFDYS